MIDRETGSPLPLLEQFRFDAGTPALNLLVTHGRRRSSEPVERLTSTRRLSEWLAGNQLPLVAVDDGRLRATRALREAAYNVLAPDQPISAADVAELAHWSGRSLPGPIPRLRGGTVAWADAPSDLEGVLTALARELASYAVDRPVALRMCEADACGMLYLDHSRGSRRRWCSMARCGNAAKVAAHRVRARTRS